MYKSPITVEVYQGSGSRSFFLLIVPSAMIAMIAMIGIYTTLLVVVVMSIQY